MQYERLFGEVAKLAGLHFEHDIPIEYSDERRQGFLVAVDAGILFEQRQGGKPGSGPEPGIAERPESPGTKEKLFYAVDKSITDLLGDYFPREKKIVIYKKVGESTADSLDIPYGVLEYVVALHEISHAVTHLGEDGLPGSGIIWEWYARADLWDRELFAQMYPLFHFAQYDEQEALDVFQKLSANQLPIYNAWQLYRHVPLKEINELLRLTRVKRFCVWVDLDAPEAQETSPPP